jgi:hypothetical protein
VTLEQELPQQVIGAVLEAVAMALGIVLEWVPVQAVALEMLQSIERVEQIEVQAAEQGH